MLLKIAKNAEKTINVKEMPEMIYGFQKKWYDK